MSWLYRHLKMNPVTSGRAESDLSVQNFTSVTLNSDVSSLNLAHTRQPTINFSTANIAIFASTATPWLTATTNAATAGPGSLWLCSSGTIFIKTGTGATTGWISVLAVAT
jgi:uncharacterized membrane protein (DUF4010 family)